MDGKVRIADIIRKAKELDLHLLPMPIGFHSPIRGFDALPPMTFARHYSYTHNREPKDSFYQRGAMNWPNEGTRFSVEISELVKHTDERGNRWSPKVTIEIYDHKKHGISQNRTKYHYNWASYMYQDDKWNNVLDEMENAADIYIKATRGTSSTDMSDWDF